MKSQLTFTPEVHLLHPLQPLGLLLSDPAGHLCTVEHLGHVLLLSPPGTARGGQATPHCLVPLSFFLGSGLSREFFLAAVLLHLHCLLFGVLCWVSVQHFVTSADVKRAL